LLGGQGGRKFVSEKVFDGGAKGMIAPADREPPSDERGTGRETQSNAADEEAKAVPGHVGNISLTGQRALRDQHGSRRPY
jgi:hypothetical protein